MKKRWLPLLLTFALLFTGCAKSGISEIAHSADSSRTLYSYDLDRFLTIVTDDPDTVDPQCTSGYYNVPLNIFDRLVEVQVNEDGSREIVPSLAESWELSEDGRVYTFHLREGVTFSNGSPLTASDVDYTFRRLLTHPEAVNQDLIMDIEGAQALRAGKTEHLSGLKVLDDTTFTITLSQPYGPFLACLSTPGASILDEESTEEAGDRFGKIPGRTIGTGSFVFSEWKSGREMVLTANQNCWAGSPLCDGLIMMIVSDSEAQRLLYESGELDILDLDNLGTEAEYFVHGDIYQSQLRQGPRVGINYIALNASIEPLNDVRVRKALQLSLDREMLLDAVFSGRGEVENGIFPRGLIGHNPDLPAIPYDLEKAKDLLSEAGLSEGFDLEISISADSPDTTRELLNLAAHQWEKIGVRATVVTLNENDFITQRKAGKLTCYTSTWSADYNDPDNFIYTFFGNRDNTRSRSLCYADKEVMDRVHRARTILDTEQRLQEYQELEKIIIQEDAAWIPLFSREHLFVVNDRVSGFQVAWNGWSSTSYRNVSVSGK